MLLCARKWWRRLLPHLTVRRLPPPLPQPWEKWSAIVSYPLGWLRLGIVISPFPLVMDKQFHSRSWWL